MHIEQLRWTDNEGWQPEGNSKLGDNAQLVLAFGGREALSNSDRYQELRQTYPQANIVTCSTSGEIIDSHVYDNSIVSTALQFDHTGYAVATVNIAECGGSVDAGRKLHEQLDKEGLTHVFVLSDGQMVNGTELVAGISEGLPENVAITGGLAGDGTNFQSTLVGIDQAPTEGNIVVVGFYGDRLKIGYGSIGGWDAFGPSRVITRSEGNVLYELDGQSALTLYKKYLGERAAELPGSALLFPLSIRTEEDSTPVVRTILSIDEENESMTFAGDMPKGAYAQLMKANFDRLVDGASVAARTSYEALGGSKPDVAILISCVGRKIVLDQRTEDEVEAVREILGEDTPFAGFYSYGEISPFTKSTKCELHNQTMTITTFSEN